MDLLEYIQKNQSCYDWLHELDVRPFSPELADLMVYKQSLTCQEVCGWHTEVRGSRIIVLWLNTFNRKQTIVWDALKNCVADLRKKEYRTYRKVKN